MAQQFKGGCTGTMNSVLGQIPTDRRWNGKREIKNQKLLRDDQFVGQNCQGHWGLLGGVRNGRNNFETWKRPPRPQEPRPAASSWYFVISMAAFHWLSAVALAGFGEGHCGPDRIPSNPLRMIQPANLAQLSFEANKVGRDTNDSRS